jgi:hypothetical protein
MTTRIRHTRDRESHLRFGGSDGIEFPAGTREIDVDDDIAKWAVGTFDDVELAGDLSEAETEASVDDPSSDPSSDPSEYGAEELAAHDYREVARLVEDGEVDDRLESLREIDDRKTVQSAIGARLEDLSEDDESITDAIRSRLDGDGDGDDEST